VQELIESLRDCIVRFLDGLFTRRSREQEEVFYLRMELEKSHQEIMRLTNKLTDNPNALKAEDEELEASKEPIHRIVPWRIRRQQLEKESREKAIENAKQAAEKKLMREQSIEELEKELLNDDAVSQ